MKIIRTIGYVLRKAIAGVLVKNMTEHYDKGRTSSLMSEDGLSDFLEKYEYSSRFRMFHSDTDYNKDLLSIFESNRNRFFFDYAHRDGHFRV